MANIKQVELDGWMPFDAGGNPNLLQMLGQLNLPVFGFTIEWGGEKYVDNKHGGKTCMYRFHVFGEEAVQIGWLRRLVDCIEAVGGKIETRYCRDIENDDELKL